ncbi:hypothetical protein SLE2022_193270 [Rubroshorea leprosula]
MSNSSNSCRSNRIGYRFHPTDEEVITFLKDKVLGCDCFVQDPIAVLGDICNYEPWELPGLSSMKSSDREWYYFCTPNYKYKDSRRVNRTTRAGYWKVTGNHRKIKSRNGAIIGEKKTLVFYEGSIRKRNGKRTCWVIHEYQLPSNEKEWVVLCKLKKKGAEAADVSSGGSQQRYESPDNAVVEDINADAIYVDDLGDIDELYKLCCSLISEPEIQLQMQEEQQQPVSSSIISPSFHGSSSNSAQNHYYSSGMNNEEEDESWLSYLV